MPIRRTVADPPCALRLVCFVVGRDGVGRFLVCFVVTRDRLGRQCAIFSIFERSELSSFLLIISFEIFRSTSDFAVNIGFGFRFRFLLLLSQID